MYMHAYLEVDDNAKDEDGCHEAHEVGEVLPVEGFLDATDLVRARGQQVEESDDRTLKLGPTTRVDGGWTEGLPDDGLTHVGSNEEGDP